MFITSKNKYLSNDMKMFGTCSIPLSQTLDGAKVNVSSQIFHLGLFYKFIVQHKNIY